MSSFVYFIGGSLDLTKRVYETLNVPHIIRFPVMHRMITNSIEENVADLTVKYEEYNVSQVGNRTYIAVIDQHP